MNEGFNLARSLIKLRKAIHRRVVLCDEAIYIGVLCCDEATKGYTWACCAM